MYVRANHFDYDALLFGIIEQADLKDEVVTNAVILKIFKNFEKKYKEQKATNTLEPWQEGLCIEFLSSIQSYSNYLESEEDEPDYHKAFEESVTEVLEELPAMVDEGQVRGSYKLVEYFLDRLYKNELVNHLSGDEFTNMLRGWLECFTRNKLEGIDKFLFDEINKNILHFEAMTDITVLDMAGTTVKYGNALITFPTILLEVYKRHE